MEKAKWLMSGCMVGLMFLLGTSAWYESSLGSSLYLKEGVFCWSDHPPYTELCREYHWWINLSVTATEDLDNVVMVDGFGVELKIEGIAMGEPQRPPTYVLAYEPGAAVSVTKGEVTGYATGFLDENGVTFDGFHVYWTGESIEAHFEWEMGALSAGETAKVFVVVSTDLNPSGQQEFTSYGTYFLDSGATVSGVRRIWGIFSRQISSESDGISIEVTKP